MGLFNWFNRKRNNGVNGSGVNGVYSDNLPDIPEGVFVERERNDNDKGSVNGSQTENGISLLFQFLERNYESKGYDDALVNPDLTHLQHNTEALKSELDRTIRKVKTFYEDFIREIDFHISSRGRSGMIDTVEELTMKKITAEQHISQVKEIEDDAHNGKGVGQSIIISYTRGFKNGLAAISHHAILRKNF